MATPAPAPRWTRLEHDERREQILACAGRLFSERHFAAVSTAQIACDAGVTRGLVHHYFGAKRALYLEVVREMVRVRPIPEEVAGGTDQERVDLAIDRWLTMVERNRGTWLAALGAEGFGRDADVEAILEEAREAAVAWLIAGVGLERPGGGAPDAVRAAVHAFTGMAEAASREWLEHERLSRAQAHALLTGTLLTLVHDLLPRLEGST